MKPKAIILFFFIAVLLLGCGGKQTIIREKTTYRVDTRYEKPDPEEYLTLGKIAYGECDFAKSIEYFAKVQNSTASSKEKAIAFAYMGASCFYLDRYDDARRYCAKAKELNPSVSLSLHDFPQEIIGFCK